MISRVMVSVGRTSVGAWVLAVLACLGLAITLGVTFSATSAMAAECPNEQLRKESNISPTSGDPYSTELPDCRAYEMISPLEKQGHGAGEADTSNGPVILPVAIAPEGGAVGWSAEGDFLDPENFGVTDESSVNGYLSRRGAAGWVTESAFAPRSIVDGPSKNNAGLEGDLSPDLSSEHVSCGYSPSGKGERNGTGQSIVCALRKGNGQWEATPAYRTVENRSIDTSGYLGGSADLSKVFFQPASALVLERGADIADNSRNAVGIYEIAGMGTPTPYLRLVNVENSGAELLLHAEGQDVGPLLGAMGVAGLGVKGNSSHAISASGNTVFFSATPPGGSLILTLYARVQCVRTAKNESTCKEDGNGEYLETVAVSDPEEYTKEHSNAKECASLQETELAADAQQLKEKEEELRAEAKVLEAEGKVVEAKEKLLEAEAKKKEKEEREKELAGCLKSATFEGASADGSKVFFTTQQQVLGSDTDRTADLYEFDFAKKEAGENPVIQISAGVPNGPNADLTPGHGAEVQGVVRASSDGSHIYFVARGVLTTKSNSEGKKAGEAGKTNLYGYDTVTGETKFIANAPEAKSFDIEEPSQQIEEKDEDRLAQTTPDGRYLVFSSPAKLAQDKNKEGVEAVYRYDFQTGELTWVSHPAPACGAPDCAPSVAGTEKEARIAARPGFHPQLAGAFADIEDWGTAITGLEVGEANGEAIDENDGEDIIFTTRQRLQANDVNEGENLYEWHCSSECNKPAGEGEAPGEGTVHMISDGQDAEGGVVEHPGGAENGGTISANGKDIVFTTDSRLVGQDSDVLRDIYDARIDGGFPAPAVSPSCSGEACQGAASSSPSFASAPTSLLTAGGNLTSPGGGNLAFVVAKPTVETRAEKLAKALKACQGKSKKKRAACEAQARKKYGKTKAKKTSTRAKAKKSARRGK